MRMMLTALLGFVIAFVAVAMMWPSRASPPSDQNILALADGPAHSVAIVDAHIYDNTNVIRQHHAAQFTSSYGLTSHGAVPAAARLTSGASTPEPMTSTKVDNYYAERLSGESFAKPARCRHPLRC